MTAKSSTQQTPNPLFSPLSLLPSSPLSRLSHRIVLAPLTRFRATPDHVPTDLQRTYYTQRARSLPGTLLITEGAYVAPRAAEVGYVPGIWTEEMIAGWREIGKDVRREGGVMFMQIWAPGRAGFLGIGGGGILPKSVNNVEGGVFEYVSSSAIPLSGDDHPTPRALTIPEIREHAQLFGKAAYNAVHRAGLDGVEVHAGQGYLVDQFLQDTCNKRDDEYGGGIEGRCRFPLEAVAEAVKQVGEERVGVRITPWGKFQDMGMNDPIPTFAYFISELKARYPSLAYLHVTEPRVSGGVDRTELTSEVPADFAHESNDVFRRLWASGEGAERRVFISAGGYTPEGARERVEKAESEGRNECIAFGRFFIANPDLPLRIKNGIPLTPYHRPSFYLPGNPEGYIDYPFADEGDSPAVAMSAAKDELDFVTEGGVFIEDGQPGLDATASTRVSDVEPVVGTRSLCVG